MVKANIFIPIFKSNQAIFIIIEYSKQLQALLLCYID
jgi:hypothetical protein